MPCAALGTDPTKETGHPARVATVTIGLLPDHHFRPAGPVAEHGVRAFAGGWTRDSTGLRHGSRWCGANLISGLSSRSSFGFVILYRGMLFRHVYARRTQGVGRSTTQGRRGCVGHDPGR